MKRIVKAVAVVVCGAVSMAVSVVIVSYAVAGLPNEGPTSVAIRDFVSVSLSWLAGCLPPAWVMILTGIGGMVGILGDKLLGVLRMSVNWSRLWTHPGLEATKVKAVAGKEVGKVAADVPFPVGSRVRLKKDAYNLPVGVGGLVVAVGCERATVCFDGREGDYQFWDKGDWLEPSEPAKVVEEVIEAKVSHEVREGMRVRCLSPHYVNAGAVGTLAKHQGGRDWYVKLDNGAFLYFDGDYLPDWLEPIEDTLCVGILDTTAKLKREHAIFRDVLDGITKVLGDEWKQGEMQTDVIKRLIATAADATSRLAKAEDRLRTLEAQQTPSDVLSRVETCLWNLLDNTTDASTAIAALDRLTEIERMRRNG